MVSICRSRPPRPRAEWCPRPVAWPAVVNPRGSRPPRSCQPCQRSPNYCSSTTRNGSGQPRTTPTGPSPRKRQGSRAHRAAGPLEVAVGDADHRARGTDPTLGCSRRSRMRTGTGSPRASPTPLAKSSPTRDSGGAAGPAAGTGSAHPLDIGLTNLGGAGSTWVECFPASSPHQAIFRGTSNNIQVLGAASETSINE